MRFLAGLVAAALLAVPAAAQDVPPLTSKEVDALSPQALAARILPLMDKNYTGKVMVPSSPGLPRLLGAVWLTGDMQPQDPGLCAADILVVDVLYAGHPYNDPETYDPPSPLHRLRTERRYAFLGAVQHLGYGPGRDAALKAVDCSKVAWPSISGTFTAESDAAAGTGLALLTEAKAQINRPGAPSMDIACAAGSDPCGSVSAIIGMIGPGTVRQIAACYDGPIPIPAPSASCAILTLGSNTVSRFFHSDPLLGAQLRLERHGESLSATFYRHVSPPIDAY